MARIIHMHPSDDELDLYLFDRLPTRAIERLDWHCSTCLSCLDRLETLAALVYASREFSGNSSARTALRPINNWRAVVASLFLVSLTWLPPYQSPVHLRQYRVGLFRAADSMS